MPVQSVGTAHDKRVERDEIMRLAALSGGGDIELGIVTMFNLEWKDAEAMAKWADWAFVWWHSEPDKIDAIKRSFGAVVVTPAESENTFSNITAADRDKTNNRTVRGGCTLIRYHKLRREQHIASCELKAMKTTNKDVADFYDLMGQKGSYFDGKIQGGGYSNGGRNPQNNTPQISMDDVRRMINQAVAEKELEIRASVGTVSRVPEVVANTTVYSNPGVALEEFAEKEEEVRIKVAEVKNLLANKHGVVVE